jgi:hypothetical protein
MVNRATIFLIASVAALALLGTGSAAATKLCTNESCSIVYPGGQAVNWSLKSGTTERLTSGGTTIATCTGSTAGSRIANESGATVSLTVESLTWEGCSQTTDTIANGSLSITAISGSKGEVTGKGTQVTAAVFGVTCTYGTGEATKLGTLTSGSEPVLTIAATVAKTAGGFLCPSTAGWDAEYLITEPHALYVAEGEPAALPEWDWQLESRQLVDLAESETLSGSGGAFTLATTIGESSASLKCESSELSSGTIAVGGKGTSTLKLSSGCQVVGQPTCTVAQPISLKAKTEALGSGSHQYNRYSPVESKFATVTISGCKFAGEYAVEGTFAGEFELGERVKEPVAFSEKIGSEAGTSLKFGGKAATLAGGFSIAASGAFAGQVVGPDALKSKPFGPLAFNPTKEKTSASLPITYTVLSKESIKFGTLSIVGGAGVFTPEKEDCSGKTKKQGESCTVTVKFEPTAAQAYGGLVSVPWEYASGVGAEVRIKDLFGVGIK